MYLPKWLFRFWRNRIYLRSRGWELTRQREFKKQGRHCRWGSYKSRGRTVCGSYIGLQLHHLSYENHPKPQWWHFLPFARFFITEQDYSPMVFLCKRHHELAHTALGKDWFYKSR